MAELVPFLLQSTPDMCFFYHLPQGHSGFLGYMGHFVYLCYFTSITSLDWSLGTSENSNFPSSDIKHLIYLVPSPTQWHVAGQDLALLPWRSSSRPHHRSAVGLLAGEIMPSYYPHTPHCVRTPFYEMIYYS